MENQKTINLLAHEDKPHKFYQTKKWYIINDQSNGQYDEGETTKINTEVIKENIYDYGDAYILVTGNVKIVGGAGNTPFCFKGPSPFTTCTLHMNDNHIETAQNLPLVIKHYNLIEYSDNYQDTVGSLYQFKRDEHVLANNALTAVTNQGNNTSSSFIHKSSLLSRLTSEVGMQVPMHTGFIKMLRS